MACSLSRPSKYEVPVTVFFPFFPFLGQVIRTLAFKKQRKLGVRSFIMWGL